MDKPTNQEIENLLNKQLVKVWSDINTLIESKYETEHLWNTGGKNWNYEYKYRKGRKTLCTFYLRKEEIGCMIIFGNSEREKFEQKRNDFSDEIQSIYDTSKTYHDGKWMMIPLVNTKLFIDIEKLLLIKRKPNRK